MPVSPPFNINAGSPAASDNISAFPPNEQSNRDIIESWLTFISDPATGLLKASAATALNPFPASTAMVFAQAAAPTGWTKVVTATYNDAALRIVTGTGGGTAGSVAFATAFASQGVAGTVGGTAITTANLPVHAHSIAGSGSTGTVSADHTHAFSGTTGSQNANHQHGTPTGHSFVTNNTGAINGGSTAGALGATGATGSENANHQHSFSGSTGGISANHTHTFSFSGTSGNAGSGTTHTHTFSGTPINLAVKYVDMIVATKDA